MGDLAEAVDERDSDCFLQALRAGAVRVRAGLSEFRAGDPPPSKGRAGQSISGTQQQQEQSGRELLRLTTSMIQAPISSQVSVQATKACVFRNSCLASQIAESTLTHTNPHGKFL